jgi:hypothetical protein
MDGMKAVFTPGNAHLYSFARKENSLTCHLSLARA